MQLVFTHRQMFPLEKKIKYNKHSGLYQSLDSFLDASALYIYIKFQPGKEARTNPKTFRVLMYISRASMSSKEVSFSFS